MFSSTIVPTVGRTTLERAVLSVLEQELDGHEHEVIVVNDSGAPLPDAAWSKAPNVQVIHTDRRERSVARNTGAAMAQGAYLHFLDDDDWLAPGALQNLYRLVHRAPTAAWLYGSTTLVDREGRLLIQLHHNLEGNCLAQVMSGEWIPLQASLISAEAFFSVGGFNPRISGPEDIDLLRRIALHGDIAGTDQVVAYLAMGAEGSTTDMANHAQASRWARENILAAPGILDRLHNGADSSEWNGRVLRLFLTSLLWNLHRGRPLTAASRGLSATASLVRSNRLALSRPYWRSVFKPYESDTFLRGRREAGLSDR